MGTDPYEKAVTAAMRIGILGGGTIGQLVCEHVGRGTVPGAEVVGIAGRNEHSRGGELAAAHGVPFVHPGERLLETGPDVVLEAAGHAAVGQDVPRYLQAGVHVIVMSGGALADDGLRRELEQAAAAAGVLLYVPSGGIGGLDALQAAARAGVEVVTLTTRKMPAAWEGIPYVQAQKVQLETLEEPRVLYEGPARDAVRHFPQNVNVAAAVSLAGVGFDRTRVRVVADPTVEHNTHEIRVQGTTGAFTITLENVPVPDNPRTTWLACYSGLAAVQRLHATLRVGT